MADKVKTVDSTKRERGGLDYQSGRGGERADVDSTEDLKPEDNKKPSSREQGAGATEDEDDGHS